MSEHPQRDAALRRTCPRCGAPPGIPCQGRSGDRRAPHASRLGRYAREVKRTEQKPIKARPVVSNQVFYNSPAWRRLRYSVLRDANGLCQCCGAGPTRGKPLHVDHIKPRSRFPELEMEASNLQVLCADCNLGKGATDTIDWRQSDRGLH